MVKTARRAMSPPLLWLPQVDGQSSDSAAIEWGNDMETQMLSRDERRLRAIQRINDERTIPLSRYQEDGYVDRFGYLKGLADEHGFKVSTVVRLADVLGPNEDFDGLVSELEDFEFMGFSE